MIKLSRVFFGGYTPNYERLAAMNYTILKKNILILSRSTLDQGYGSIRGSVKKSGVNLENRLVSVFKRSNRQLLWEVTTKQDGLYSFRNIAEGLECFVVSFDPDKEYNAVIQDIVIAK